MRWRFFTFCTAVSTALFLIVCVLWLRSYWTSDQLELRYRHGWRKLSTASGHLVFEMFIADWSNVTTKDFGLRYRRDTARPPLNWLIFLSPERNDRYVTQAFGGFARYERRNIRRGIVNGIYVMPFWSIAAATGILPLAWFVRRRRARVRARRRDLNLCAVCGYDLRETPHRCPECGTLAEPETSVAVELKQR